MTSYTTTFKISIFAIHSDCIFGYWQWFGCLYLLWCYVPYVCCINYEAFLGSCWSSTFCQIPSGTTPCYHAFLYIILFFIFIEYSGSFTAFHIYVSLICAAIWFTENIFCSSSSLFVLLWSTIHAHIQESKHFILGSLYHCYHLIFGWSSDSLTCVHSWRPYLSLDVHKLSMILCSLFWYRVWHSFHHEPLSLV